MAIDYGTKRVGIAVTDPLHIIATGLTTVHSKDILDFLKKYFEKEKVETVVIGEPKELNNKDSEMTKHVDGFVKRVKEKFPALKIQRMDERFTSRIAFQTMIAGGLKKEARKNKSLVDEISATLILQSYLQSISNK